MSHHSSISLAVMMADMLCVGQKISLFTFGELSMNSTSFHQQGGTEMIIGRELKASSFNYVLSLFMI